MPARDTSREAHAAQLRAYARMGPERRVTLAYELSEGAREIAIEGLALRRPALSRAEARAIVLRRILGPELFDAAWRRPGPGRR